MFKLSQKSLDRLVGVNPDLIRVVKRAIELSPIDFAVVQGVRTQDEQNALYEQGRTKPGKIVTWTKDSKHVGGKAVDLCPFPIDWEDTVKFDKIAVAMLQAAKELGVKITWGGSWVKSKDRPHFQIEE